MHLIFHFPIFAPKSISNDAFHQPYHPVLQPHYVLLRLLYGSVKCAELVQQILCGFRKKSLFGADARKGFLFWQIFEPRKNVTLNYLTFLKTVMKSKSIFHIAFTAMMPSMMMACCCCCRSHPLRYGFGSGSIAMD